MILLLNEDLRLFTKLSYKVKKDSILSAKTAFYTHNSYPSSLKFIRLIVIIFIFPIFIVNQSYSQDSTGKSILEIVVSDSTTGELLPGVSLVLEQITSADTTKQVYGAVTNLDGFYSFNIPEGKYLITVSFIGYDSFADTVKIDSAKKTTKHIKLNTSLADLDHIVVVGFGIRYNSDFFNLFGKNYFLFGFDSGETDHERQLFQNSNQVKFRVSFKYKLLGIPPLDYTGLYAVYTQNSFWHLYDQSSPFFDNNYQPGVILYLDNHNILDYYDLIDIDNSPQSSFFIPSLHFGIVHESNGRDLLANRSWNRVLYGFNFGKEDINIFSASLSFWKAWGIAPENENILDYAGRGQLSLSIKPFRDEIDFGLVELSSESRIFGKKVINNIAINLMFHPFGKIGEIFTPSFMLQFFSGYGENLLTYSEKRNAFRLGIAFSR